MNSSTRLDTLPTSQLATITGALFLSGGPVAHGTNYPWVGVTKTATPSGSKSPAPSGVSKSSAPPFPPFLISAPPLVPVNLHDSHR